MTPDTLTPDQQACLASLAEWAGGERNLPSVTPFGQGLAIHHTGDLATFDNDALTRLVLIAHRDAVRVEIQPASPTRIRIAAFKRDPFNASGAQKQWGRHPRLADLSDKLNNFAPQAITH